MTEIQDFRVLEDVTARSRAPGVVACSLYREGRRAQDMSINECQTISRDEDGVLWIGLYEPDEALLQIVQRQFGLHDLLIEDAHQAHHRPKLDVYDDVLFIAVRTAHLVEGAIELGETHLVVGKGYVSPSGTALRHPMLRFGIAVSGLPTFSGSAGVSSFTASWISSSTAISRSWTPSRTR
jgi:CorA-like Mg2+ transporter protein